MADVVCIARRTGVGGMRLWSIHLVESRRRADFTGRPRRDNDSRRTGSRATHRDVPTFDPTFDHPCGVDAANANHPLPDDGGRAGQQ